MGSYLSRKATSTGGTHRVIVYSSPTCVWCMRAKTYLRTRGVPFRDVDVSRDPSAARNLGAPDRADGRAGNRGRR